MSRMFAVIALTLFMVPKQALTETLSFCYDPYPPYASGAEGPATGGLKVDLLNAVVDNIDGLSASVIIMPWKRCQAEAKSGQVDGILPLFPNDARSEYLAFTEGTFDEQSVLWHRTDQFPSGFRWDGDFDQLSHLRLGMLTGSYVDDAMERTFENARGITRARNIQKLMELLIKERVDLVSTDSKVGLHILQANGWQKLAQQMEPPVTSRASHFGLSKASGADRHLEAFNRAISKLASEGVIEQIFNGAAN